MECQPLYMMVVLFMSAMTQADAAAWSGLTTIPNETTPGDPELYMKDCNLGYIPKDAFLTYSNLLRLLFQNTGIQYIEEGAFNGLDKLVNFSSINNIAMQLPADFGPPTRTLTVLGLWGSLPRYSPIVYPYFEAFENLEILNIGGSYLFTFQADNVPPKLKEIYMGYSATPKFPNYLATRAPMLQKIYLFNCGMHTMLLEDVIGLRDVTHLNIRFNDLPAIPDISFMNKLEHLELHNNRLTSVPDLYDLPLTRLTLKDNPLICDEALCWVRMWPWTRPASPIPTDEPVCAGPAEVAGKKMMEVDPAFMKCFNGEVFVFHASQIPKFRTCCWFLDSHIFRFDLPPPSAMNCVQSQRWIIDLIDFSYVYICVWGWQWEPSVWLKCHFEDEFSLHSGFLWHLRDTWLFLRWCKYCHMQHTALPHWPLE